MAGTLGRNDPDKSTSYSDRNLRFTWREFNKRVDDMAKGLIAIGGNEIVT